MRILLVTLTFGSLIAFSTVVQAHGDRHENEVSLTGEVLDLTCYFQHPKSGQGPEHAACARQCINKGLPAGLKVGKKIYLLLGKGHDPAADVIAAVAGKQATVTGALIKQGGMEAIVVEKAVEARSGK